MKCPIKECKDGFTATYKGYRKKSSKDSSSELSPRWHYASLRTHLLKSHSSGASVNNSGSDSDNSNSYESRISSIGDRANDTDKTDNSDQNIESSIDEHQETPIDENDSCEQAQGENLVSKSAIEIQEDDESSTRTRRCVGGSGAGAMPLGTQNPGSHSPNHQTMHPGQSPTPSSTPVSELSPGLSPQTQAPWDQKPPHWSDHKPPQMQTHQPPPQSHPPPQMGGYMPQYWYPETNPSLLTVWPAV